MLKAFTGTKASNPFLEQENVHYNTVFNFNIIMIAVRLI